ncbi:MAG: hypothetical protein E7221_04730 [Clostridiales bacterium]|nr:hypothetical protein [Clostridiales bacterium]
MKDKITDAQIEEQLKKAIDDSTPDIFEELMAEIREEQAAGEAGQIVPQSEEAVAVREVVPHARRRRRRLYRTIAGCAAALLIFVGGFSMFHKGQEEVFAVVDIDVNPSVELSVDEAHKIIDAKALNDDGNIILDEMDLKGVDINTACNALAGSMLKHGYLSEMSNSVMVSVQSEHKEDGLAIEQMVSGNLNDYLQDTEISGAVLGQYVDGDEALAAFAAEHNISAGKAWLIKNLMATNSKHMTEDALLKLSTQELILLSQERDVDVDDFYGDVDKSKYISKEDAIKAALQAAGLNDLQVDSGKAEFDCDDGIITYEVEFTANGQEYEYDINAQTGEIIKSEVDVDDGDDDADDAEDADDEYDDDHDAGDYDDDYDDGDDDHDDHDRDDDDHDEDD